LNIAMRVYYDLRLSLLLNRRGDSDLSAKQVYYFYMPDCCILCAIGDRTILTVKVILINFIC
jgi:hypothetical protein